LRFALTDHFNRVDDTQAATRAVFVVPLAPAGGESLVRLGWRNATTVTGELEASVDGKVLMRTAVQRPAQFGVNYLRVEFQASATAGAVLISDLVARVR
jgi:hypothetical protein